MSISLSKTATQRGGPHTLYICHGDPQGQIFFYGYGAEGATLTPRPPGHAGASTSFAANHPSKRVIYGAQNRTDHLAAMAVPEPPTTPPLRVLNRVAVPPAEGVAQSGPAYVTTDPAGRFLLAADYRGHNVVVFALEPDGRVGPLLQNLSPGKHAHLVRFTPDGRFVLVPCLGSDLIAQLRFDPVSGLLRPNDPPSVGTPAGAGPRHLDFHPHARDGVRAVFVINELDASLAAYHLDEASGTLSERCRVDSLPAGYSGQRWAAHVAVSPSGRFVYVCNRAHDSLGVFAWDGDALTPVQHLPCGGKTPRHFALDPAGRFLLVVNQDSGNLAVFAVDSASGRLAPHAVHPVGALPYYVGWLAPAAGATL